MTSTHLFDVIRAVQRCVKRGEMFICDSSAVRRSFTFTGPFDRWEVTLVQVKTAFPTNDWEQYVQELFHTEDGRQKLCQEVLDENHTY